MSEIVQFVKYQSMGNDSDNEEKREWVAKGEMIKKKNISFLKGAVSTTINESSEKQNSINNSKSSQPFKRTFYPPNVTPFQNEPSDTYSTPFSPCVKDNYNYIQISRQSPIQSHSEFEPNYEHPDQKVTSNFNNNSRLKDIYDRYQTDSAKKKVKRNPNQQLDLFESAQGIQKPASQNKVLYSQEFYEENQSKIEDIWERDETIQRRIEEERKYNKSIQEQDCDVTQERNELEDTLKALKDKRRQLLDARNQLQYCQLDELSQDYSDMTPSEEEELPVKSNGKLKPYSFAVKKYEYKGKKGEKGEFKYNDEVERILSVSHKDVHTKQRSFLVEFKPRSDGFQPLNNIYTQDEIQAHAPEKLLDYYIATARFYGGDF